MTRYPTIATTTLFAFVHARPPSIFIIVSHFSLFLSIFLFFCACHDPEPQKTGSLVKFSQTTNFSRRRKGTRRARSQRNPRKYRRGRRDATRKSFAISRHSAGDQHLPANSLKSLSFDVAKLAAATRQLYLVVASSGQSSVSSIFFHLYLYTGGRKEGSWSVAATTSRRRRGASGPGSVDSSWQSERAAVWTVID